VLSQSNGRLSTITQVKGLSPEMFSLHWARGWLSLKPASLHAQQVSMPATCRGLRPW
jgi:hypothetical protein